MHNRLSQERNLNSHRDRLVWHVHGNCLRPAAVTSPDRPGREWLVRCRKCANCRNAKRSLWSRRILDECTRHRNNWLFTGTFANQTRDPDTVNAEITKFLKRLRKNTKAKVRYFAAIEPHKTGNLHCHLMIHSNDPVTYRAIKQAWKVGFSDAKRVTIGGTGYAAKYVAKEISGRRLRTRASRSYGSNVIDREYDEAHLLQRCEICQNDQDAHRKEIFNLIYESPNQDQLGRKILNG